MVMQEPDYVPSGVTRYVLRRPQRGLLGATIFVFAFPVLLLLIFGAIFKGTIAPGVPFIRYFVSGIIAAGLMSVGFQSLAIQIPIERDRGVLKRLASTPMPRASYFIGKVVMVLVTGVLETAVLLAVAVAGAAMNAATWSRVCSEAMRSRSALTGAMPAASIAAVSSNAL